MNKQTLSELLANNQLEELFDALKIQHSQYGNQLLLIEGRWNDLKTRQRSGTVSDEQANLEMSKIRVDLLDIIEQSESPTTTAPTATPRSSSKGLIIGLIAIIGLLLACLIYTQVADTGTVSSEPTNTGNSGTSKRSTAAQSKTLDTSGAPPMTLAPGNDQYERVYSVMNTSIESIGGGKSLITLHIGINFKGIISHLWGTNSFRLVSDQLPGPLAPSNFMSEVVSAKSFMEGDIKFELNDDVKQFSIIIEDKPDKRWEFSR